MMSSLTHVANLIAVAALTCAIISMTYSLAPAAPTPASAPPVLAATAPWAAGKLCTFPAARFETTNASCYPEVYNDPVNLTYCINRRLTNASDCIIAMCTQYLSIITSQGRTLDLTFSTSDKLRLVNANTSDLGSVRLVDVLQQFMIQNRPTTDGSSPPQPLDYVGPRTYYTTDVDVLNFTVSARSFARELFAFKWNYNSLTTGTLNPVGGPGADFSAFITSVVTPSTCPVAEVAAIPWIQGNTFSVVSLSNMARGLVALNMTYTKAEWDIACLDVTFSGPFCKAFQGYYSFESLTNYSIVPSPFRDVTAILKAFNEEYTDCGQPRGCFASRVF